MPSVLFVCTANVCRSPIAEALFRHRLKLLDVESDWSVGSAGTWARDRALASRRAQIALYEWGADLQGHRSRNVSRDLLNQYDLILVMERGQHEALRVEFPDIAHRIHRLSEMAGYTFDIPDPMGGTQSDVSDVANEMHMLLARGFARISTLANSSTVLRLNESKVSPNVDMPNDSTAACEALTLSGNAIAVARKA